MDEYLGRCSRLSENVKPRRYTSNSVRSVKRFLCVWEKRIIWYFNIFYFNDLPLSVLPKCQHLQNVMKNDNSLVTIQYVFHLPTNEVFVGIEALILLSVACVYRILFKRGSWGEVPGQVHYWAVSHPPPRPDPSPGPVHAGRYPGRTELADTHPTGMTFLSFVLVFVGIVGILKLLLMHSFIYEF